MAKQKIHIDELFRKGLSNLSLFVSNRDLEAIDDKKSVFEDKDEALNASVMQDFEMEVTDSDWLLTKARLDNEKSMMAAKGVFAEAFSDFEIPARPGDFAATMRKYRLQRAFRKYRWTGSGLILLLLLFALQYTQSGSERPSAPQTLANVRNQTETPVSGKGSAQQPSALPQGIHAAPAASAATADEAQHAVTGRTQNFSAGKSGQPALKTEPGLAAASRVLEGGVRLNVTPEPAEPLPATAILPEPDATAEVPTDPGVNTVQPETSFSSAEEMPKAPSKDTPVLQQDNTPKKPLPKPGALVFYGSLVNTLQTDFRILPKSNNAFYNAIRNNGEQPGFSWTKGIELGVMKGRNMFNTGLLHNSQDLQTHYRYKYKVYDSIPVRNPQGQIIGYFLFNGKDTLIDKKQTVRKSSVRIPFEYSRLVRVNNKMNLVCGMAAVLSIQTGSSGDGMLNPANRQLYPYETFKPMERRFNISPAVNFGLQYALGKHLELQGGISGSAALFSRFKNNFGASEYNYNTGINIKLLYKLQ